MESIRIFTLKVFFVAFIATNLFTSCNDDYLQEVPKSFLSPENTFVDNEGFESGIAELHRIARTIIGTSKLTGMSGDERDKGLTTLYISGTDFGWYWNKRDYSGDYTLVNSFNRTVQNYWIRFYTLIKDANILLTRSESEEVVWDSETDKVEIQAQARFFRALGYRYLVYLFGGVPIIESEITGPKLDFVRASKDEVLDFILADLEFATSYLPSENNRDGKIVKAAADHFLAETYISKGQYDKAIEAASRVINDSQYELMTSRFGTPTNAQGLFLGSVPPSFDGGDNPGNVFWDLFRLGNQNIPENKEVIWAVQFEYNVPGGGDENRLERIWGPRIERLTDPDGNGALLKDEYLGRPGAFPRPSNYLEYEIWRSDWDNDIRNAEFNNQRVYYINNPASAYYGQAIVPPPADTVRNHFVYFKKASHPYGHPQGYDTGGRLYSDFYMIRLAETYLLRAEAYLDKGDKANAAADINVVRSRANANPVAEANVDIHYILDERARELVVEEPRRLTLARLGLLYDRVKKYNPISAPSIQEYNTLWPIPQTEIDANLGAELTQNPGY